MRVLGLRLRAFDHFRRLLFRPCDRRGDDQCRRRPNQRHRPFQPSAARPARHAASPCLQCHKATPRPGRNQDKAAHPKQSNCVHVSIPRRPGQNLANKVVFWLVRRVRLSPVGFNTAQRARQKTLETAVGFTHSDGNAFPLHHRWHSAFQGTCAALTALSGSLHVHLCSARRV